MKPTVASTIAFIQQAHAGQADKQGLPYWLHLHAVMERLGAASDNERMAALLHDVLEDTPTTAVDLLNMGYPEEVAVAVQLVTRPRNPKPPYIEWIRSIAASGNATAIRIKIADCEHNSDPDRLASIPIEAERTSLAKRYSKALSILRPPAPGKEGENE